MQRRVFEHKVGSRILQTHANLIFCTRRSLIFCRCTQTRIFVRAKGWRRGVGQPLRLGVGWRVSRVRAAEAAANNRARPGFAAPLRPLLLCSHAPSTGTRVATLLCFIHDWADTFPDSSLLEPPLVLAPLLAFVPRCLCPRSRYRERGHFAHSRVSPSVSPKPLPSSKAEGRSAVCTCECCFRVSR